MNEFCVREIADADLREKIAREVLKSLPEWFGIPETLEEYVRNCRNVPLQAAYAGNEAAGFIAMNVTGNATAEIYVMGVKKEFHRTGIGRALYDAIEEYARQQGYEYMQVKTVQMGKYPEYDATNRFYIAMGFREFECFPDMWDEANPCQIYVKYICNS